MRYVLDSGVAFKCPEQFCQGDEVIALIPDRDTLTLVPVPPTASSAPSANSPASQRANIY